MTVELMPANPLLRSTVTDPDEGGVVDLLKPILHDDIDRRHHLNRRCHELEARGLGSRLIVEVRGLLLERSQAGELSQLNAVTTKH